jgi:hypothetical protein
VNLSASASSEKPGETIIQPIFNTVQWRIMHSIDFLYFWDEYIAYMAKKELEPQYHGYSSSPLPYFAKPFKEEEAI